MSYAPDSLKLVINDVGGGIPRVFTYVMAADSDATITGASFFSDGVTKGMRVGDLVHVVGTTGPKYKLYQVASVSGAAATLSAPTAIT